jgi:hypothetical protein
MALILLRVFLTLGEMKRKSSRVSQPCVVNSKAMIIQTLVVLANLLEPLCSAMELVDLQLSATPVGTLPVRN